MLFTRYFISIIPVVDCQTRLNYVFSRRSGGDIVAPVCDYSEVLFMRCLPCDSPAIARVVAQLGLHLHKPLIINSYRVDACSQQ